jgi:hypothetical protein
MFSNGKRYIIFIQDSTLEVSFRVSGIGYETANIGMLFTLKDSF